MPTIPTKITRDFLRKNPDIYVVFGDNILCRGYGGQAKECRGMPNAFGVPTKRCPEMDEKISFFRDELFETYAYYIDKAIAEIPKGKPLYVIPGIGQGLSRMKEKAPKLYKYMIDKLNALEPINKGMF
jgi:hypothetical protein